MQASGVNMQDVRDCLGVKSVRWKIEKRVLERIGHVVRMGNDRLTKAMVFGWYEGLEGKQKMLGRKRKTVLYWKRVLIECGIDWTDIERMCSDRDGWKKCVDEQVRHMNIWKRQKGQNYNWGPIGSKIDRIETRLIYLVSRYERCGKSNFPGKQ